jgi:membrane-anchored protein YejM (alkaline phosphatase superfamily)
MKKNLLIILIDALRFDRLVAGGYKYNLTPNLNKIIKKGTLLTNHYANGCPTQVSFPSIFTSTYPLDFKGYEKGIKNRPKTFAEVFKNNGYQTFGLTTAHTSGDHFGYHRGFDNYENLLDFYQWFRQNLKVFLREPLRDYKENKIDKKEILETLSINYLEVLNSTLFYIDQFIKIEVKSKNFDVKKNRIRVIKEIEILKKDPEIILKKFLEFDYWYYLFLGQTEVSKFDRFYIGLREKIRDIANSKVVLFPRRKFYNASEVFKRFKIFFNKKKNDKPIMGFLHLFDVHESKNFTSRLSISWIIDVIKLLLYRKFKMGGFVYDLALIQTDREIGKFFKYLKKNKILDNTKLVFTSDHGLQTGFPLRKKDANANLIKGSDLSQQFFDEFTHVPLIFYPKTRSEVNENSFSSHIDFAPTILNFCEIPEEKNFKGKSIFSKNYYTEFVLSENTGSGLCNIQKKDIFICIKNINLKITYIVHNKEIKERDVFNLKNDPNELNNIVKEKILEKERKKLFIYCENRIKEIFDYV